MRDLKLAIEGTLVKVKNGRARLITDENELYEFDIADPEEPIYWLNKNLKKKIRLEIKGTLV